MKKLDNQEIRNIQLNILKSVDQYCNERGLSYFLGYGTLLGAVRHKGYIPWDDDIDILMPRPDYEIFTREFKYNDDYKVYSHYIDSNYPYTFAKVSYEKSVLKENTDLKFNKLGVNIDVFPLDGFPDSENERKKIFRYIRLKENILKIKSIAISSSRRFYKNKILYLGKIVLYPISYKKIITKINERAIKFNYEDSNYAGCIVCSYGYKEIMPKDIFKNRCKLKFEGNEFFVPSNYHKYLSNIYGDYMNLPPIENRITHHDFEAFLR